jgi:thymidylate synthase
MQTIAVFQQNGSGTTKIQGINRFGDSRFQIQIFDIEADLPTVLDDTSAYLPQTIEADLVLDYLRHHDLSEDLSRLCEKLKIPMVSSGKKIRCGSAICPPTCCTLADHRDLAEYGRLFGAPKIRVSLDQDQGRERIERIEVLRGAPCGATWLAADKVKGLPLSKAMTRFGLEVQFFCSANPAGWDPIYGKSPVHVAADIHTAALKTGLKKGNFSGSDPES